MIILSVIGFPISTHAAERGFIESVYCKVISFFKLSCDNEDTALTINTESDTDVAFSSSPAPHSDEDVFGDAGSPTQTATDTSFSGSSPAISTYPLSPSVHTSYATIAYLDGSLMLLRSELLNSKNPISYVSGSSVSSERLSKQVDSIYDSVSKSISTLRDETNLNLASATTALQSELQAITANITGGALFNGGNAFGAPLTMGTTDTQALSLITGGTERLTVRANGNVGIGTSTPSSKLSVGGDIDLSGILKINGGRFISTYGGETNAFLGLGSGNQDYTGTNSLGIGYLTLSSMTGAVSATAVGSRALQDLTTGTNNTAIGQGTLRYITTSSNNTAIGRQAGNGLLSGGSNTIIGSNAMQNTQYATNTIAIGASTLFQSNDAGQDSIFIGNSAGRGVNGGLSNTFIGTSAGGTGVKTGGNNLLLGSHAGSNLNSGSNNIIIGGNNIFVPIPSANNQLNIGNLIYGTGLDGTLSTVSTGNVGIGTTTPSEKLTVSGNGLLTGTLTASSFTGAGTGLTGLAPANFSTANISQWTNDAGYLTGLSAFTTDDVAQGSTNLYSQWSPATGGINYAGGNVGIGTSTPDKTLTIRHPNPSYNSYVRIGTGMTSNASMGIGLSAYNSTSPDYVITVNNSGAFNIINGSHTMSFEGNRLSAARIRASTFGTPVEPSFMLDTTSGDETGFYRPELNTIGFVTDRTEQMRITANGNIGIGTITPRNKLHIHGATDSVLRFTSALTGLSASDGFYFGLNTDGVNTTLWNFENGYVRLATNNVERMRVDSSGNIGIGTTAPVYTLDVYGSGVRSAVATGAKAFVGFSSDTGVERFSLESSGSLLKINSAGSINIEPVNNVGIGLGGSDATSRLVVKGGGTGAGSSALGVTNSAGASLLFVRNDGNVGIGTTSPSSKLDVYGGIRASGNLTDYVEITSGSVINKNQYGDRYYISANGTSQLGLPVGYDGGAIQLQTGSSKSVITGGGSGTSQLSFFTGNNLTNPKMIISGSGGNVGIGTTTPFARLSVRGAGTTTGLLAQFSDSADTPRVTVLDNGNVGIGTTNPGAKLQINGAGASAVGLLLTGDAGYSSNNQMIRFNDATAGTIATIVASPQSSGSGGQLFVDFNSPSSTSSPYNNWLAYRFGGATNKWFFGDDGTNAYFQTSNSMRFGVTGGAHPNPQTGTAMTILSSGNIGIGTTTPVARLSVKGAGTNTGLLAQFTNSTDTSRLRLLDNGTMNLSGNSTGFLMTLLNGTGGGSGLSITTQTVSSSATILGASNSSSEVFSVKANGNIGIGTTTPSEKLTVDGNARFTTVTSGAYAFDLNLTADGVLTTSASDERLKRDITRLDSKDTLDRMMMLEPSSFIWKEGGAYDLGLIAQEVEIVFPELVFTNGADGFKGINYSRLPALLISAVQAIVDRLDSFTTLFKTERIETEVLCIGQICLTEAQLLELLEMKANQTSGGTAPTQSSSTESTPQFQQAEQAESNQSEESDVTEEVYDNTDVNQTQNVSMDDIDGETSTQVDVVTETEPEAQEASAREDSADTIQIQGSDSE